MTTDSFFKKYALFGLVLGLFSLLLVLVVKSRIPDDSVSPETERVYKVPQRRAIEIADDRLPIDSTQHSAKVRVIGTSASQHKDQEVLLSPDLKKIERLKEIEALFEEQDGIVIRNPLKILEMLKLEAEMQKLGREIGFLGTAEGRETNAPENEEPFALKMGQLVLSNLTPDGRLPVSVGEKVVDLLVESGDIDGAATVYMATQRAMENGDKFFTPGHLTDDQFFSDEPCCPDEPAPVHHETTTGKTPTLSTPEKLSPERFSKARQFIDEYGTEEGLHRLREMDPDTARRFERERRGTPSRSSPKGDDYSDDQPPDDAP